jgi:hypothetical protein
MVQVNGPAQETARAGEGYGLELERLAVMAPAEVRRVLTQMSSTRSGPESTHDIQQGAKRL